MLPEEIIADPRSDKVRAALANHEQRLGANYLQTFQSLRSPLGSSIHDILEHFAPDTDDAWTVLNRAIYWKKMNRLPLTQPEETIAACTAIRGALSNGGFHQYFFNSSGDLWKQFLQTLVDGRDIVGEEHFRDTLAIFPSGEPPTDRMERLQQLADIRSADEPAMWNHFERQTASYYDSPYPSDRTLWTALRSRPNESFIPEPE